MSELNPAIGTQDRSICRVLQCARGGLVRGLLLLVSGMAFPAGAEPTPSDPTTFAALVKRQLEVWGRKVADAGIKPE